MRTASRLTVLIPFVVLAFSAIRVAADPSEDSVQAILESFRYTESLPANFRWQAEYHDEIAPFVIAPEQKETQRRIQTVTHIYDREGRVRLETETSWLDKGGRAIPEGHKVVRTYDKTKEMTLDAAEGARTVTITNSEHVNSIRKPSNLISAHAVPVSKLMEEALAAKLPITLEPKRVDARDVVLMTVPTDDGKASFKFWLDPQKLNYPFQIEKYRDGQLVMQITTTPQEVQKDLWLPVEGHKKTLSYNRGKQAVQEDSFLKVKKVEVNVPDLPPKLFEIELTPGTLVVDNRFGVSALQYFYGVGRDTDAVISKMAADATADMYQRTIQTIGRDDLLATTAAPPIKRSLHAPTALPAPRLNYVWLAAAAAGIILAAMLIRLRLQRRSAHS